MLDPAVAPLIVGTGQRIIITGAGGWLGLATLELLSQALGGAFAERVVAFGSSARTLQLRSGLTIEQQPLLEIGQLPDRPSLVLHFAFLTKEKAQSMDEAAYRAANQQISRNLLDALDGIGAQAIFVASSGAATRADDPSANPEMQLYGAMKRDDEDRFAQWAEASGRRAAICRIFSLTGPYINKHGSYAFACFLLDALAGRPIAVKAPREVVRSYVAIRELMSLAFALLLAEPSGVIRFDSGGDALELGDVARAIAAVLPGKGVNRAPITQSCADSYHGDGQAYAALLARYRIAPVSLVDQINESIAYLRAVNLKPQ